MTTKTAKLIFWVGTISSAVLFLALTFDTHKKVSALTHADRLSDDVVAGKHVFQKYNCNDCHTILGFGAYYSPDLTSVFSRRGEAYIRNIISKPELVLANSFRKMPQQNVSASETDNLVSFFKWVNDIDTHDWPPQDHRKGSSAGVNQLVAGATVSRGAALFKENGCFDCHKLGGVGGDGGPALDSVGVTLKAEAISQIIVNPQSVNPNSEMPAFNLPKEDVEAIAEFLSRQGGGQ